MHHSGRADSRTVETEEDSVVSLAAVRGARRVDRHTRHRPAAHITRRPLSRSEAAAARQSATQLASSHRAVRDVGLVRSTNHHATVVKLGWGMR